MKHNPHESGWSSFLARVAGVIDLETSARTFGAIVRKRYFKTASALLRTAMAYGPGGLSLRSTAAWATARGVANVTDVALMYRLRGCAKWLGAIAGSLVSTRASVRGAGSLLGRLRLIDATVISAPGKAMNWRLHASFDAAQQCFDHLELTDIRGAEKLERAPARPGEVWVADRCYARPQGLAHLIEAKADYVVRVGSRSLQLTNADGTPFKLLAALKKSQQTGSSDQSVLFMKAGQKNWKPRAARLIVVRMPAEMAAKSRRRSQQESARGQHESDPIATAAAGHLILMTSLSERKCSTATIAAIYKVRWQIEMAFKRLKSILHIDKLRAKDPDLVRTWIYAHLIAALMIQDLGPDLRDSPPSANGISTSRALPLAHHKAAA